MDIKKLKAAMEQLKEDLGKGLIASDILMKHDGQAIESHNSNPKACAFAAVVYKQLQDMVGKAGFPLIKGEILLELEDNKSLLILPQGDYLWGMLLDTKETQMGLLMNIIVPTAIKNLAEAINS